MTVYFIKKDMPSIFNYYDFGGVILVWGHSNQKCRGLGVRIE